MTSLGEKRPAMARPALTAGLKCPPERWPKAAIASAEPESEAERDAERVDRVGADVRDHRDAAEPEEEEEERAESFGEQASGERMLHLTTSESRGTGGRSALSHVFLRKHLTQLPRGAPAPRSEGPRRDAESGRGGGRIRPTFSTSADGRTRRLACGVSDETTPRTTGRSVGFAWTFVAPPQRAMSSARISS